MSINKIRPTVLLLLLAINLSGQINTYSPYSRFGLGELSSPGFGQNMAMGNSGIAYRSDRAINYINPASYTAQDTMSFLFDFGLNAGITNYQTTSLNTSLKNMNIHHIGIAFPVTKWWKASIGINPYSSVGYNIVDKRSIPENDLLLDYYFQGNGGINRFYMGSSIMLFRHLSIGMNMSYLFGYINHIQRVDFPVEDDYARTYVDDRKTIKDAVLNFGLQYHETIGEKFFFTLGAVYDKNSSLKTQQTSLIQNFYSGSKVVLNDSTIINPSFEISRDETEGTTIYPEKYGLGLSFGIKDKLNVMGEYEAQNWSECLIMGKSDSLVNSNAMRFGMEYTPNAQAIRGYFNKVKYRLGGYYSNTYIRILGEQLNDYGITFGVGLPFRGTKTTFNLGLVLGQRGTTENNLIKENYGIVNVSFTLHDFWFLKRKFD